MDKEVNDCSKGIKQDGESNKGFPFMAHSFCMQEEVTVYKIQKKRKGAEAKQMVLSETLARSRVAQ